MSHKSLSVLIATSTDRLVVTRETKVQTDCVVDAHMDQFFTDHAKTHDYTGLPNVKLELHCSIPRNETTTGSPL